MTQESSAESARCQKRSRGDEPAPAPAGTAAGDVGLAAEGRLLSNMAAMLLLVTVGGLVHLGWLVGLDVLGWDTYPVLMASRIASFGDFVGTFTEPLMDGRYSGLFYRPVLNLTFAFDQVVWGFPGPGPHVTTVALLVACGISLFLLLQRMLGGRAIIAPLLAAVLLLLHPCVVEVLPVPPRRPELLAGLFMALALWAQLEPRRLDGRWWSVTPACLALLAMGSKETAFVVVPLVLAGIVLFVRASGLRERLRRIAWLAIPHVLALVLICLVRWGVLGGVGGHEDTSLAAMVERFYPTLVSFAIGAVTPAGVSPWLGWGGLIVLAVAAVGLAGLLVADRALLLGRSVLVGTLWLVGVCAISAASGIDQAWYLFLPVMGVCLVVGSLLHGVVMALAGGGVGTAQAERTDAGAPANRQAERAQLPAGDAIWRARRGRSIGVLLAVVGGAGLLLLGGAWGRYSPGVHRYEEWARASDASRRYFRTLDERLRDAKPGQLVESPPLPRGVKPAASEPTVHGAAILWGYSVQAWLEYQYPARNARFIIPRRASDLIAADDEIVVVFRGVRAGYAWP